MSRPLREIYGALFLDCPSGISLLSENVLRAADVLIVPLVPAPLSLRSPDTARMPPKPRSEAALIYCTLWAEIRSHLDGAARPAAVAAANASQARTG